MIQRVGRTLIASTMAAKKSRPQTRTRRSLPSLTVPNLDVLHEHIEQERGRLLDAEAVLDCVIYAMEEDVRLDVSGPSYANVVRIVRSIVRSTIDQLDSVNLKAAETSGVQEAAVDNYTGVRETPPVYVH